MMMRRRRRRRRRGEIYEVIDGCLWIVIKGKRSRRRRGGWGR